MSEIKMATMSPPQKKSSKNVINSHKNVFLEKWEKCFNEKLEKDPKEKVRKMFQCKSDKDNPNKMTNYSNVKVKKISHCKGHKRHKCPKEIFFKKNVTKNFLQLFYYLKINWRSHFLMSNKFRWEIFVNLSQRFVKIFG